MAPPKQPVSAHASKQRPLILYHNKHAGEVEFLETEVWKYFLTQGPWAILFVWSYYTWKKEARDREKESREREVKLLETLNAFSEKYDLIREEIRDLATKVTGGNQGG